MAWTPILGTVIQYAKNAGGAAANAHYLKFYAAGTSTPIVMAQDGTGTPTLAKAQLDSLGYPINGSSDPFIPHIDQKYRLVFYPTAADADANTFANAVWDVDNIGQYATTNESISLDYIADMTAETAPLAERVIELKDYSAGAGAGRLYFITKSGTGTDDAGSVINHDSLNFYYQQIFGDTLTATQFGADPADSTTGSATAINNAIAYAAVNGKRLVDKNVYYLSASLDLSQPGGSDLPRNFIMELGGLKPTNAFPVNGFMITLGTTSTAELRNPLIRVWEVDGERPNLTVRDVSFLRNDGATRGLIETNEVKNCDYVYHATGSNFASASTKFKAQLLNNNGKSIVLEGTAGVSIAEGGLIDIQFLANSRYPGVTFGDTARYCMFSNSQSDFNGKYLAEFELDISGSGVNIGDAIVQGGNNATVYSVYQKSDAGGTVVWAVLADELQDTALLTNGALTIAGNPFVASNYRKAAAGNWYPDVVDNAWDAANPFTRQVISMSFIAGYVSDFRALSSNTFVGPNVASSFIGNIGPWEYGYDPSSVGFSLIREKSSGDRMMRLSGQGGPLRFWYSVTGGRDIEMNGIVSAFDAVGAVGGTWDSPHFVLGSAAFGFHIWQFGNTMWRKATGAPTSATDGLPIGPLRKFTQSIGVTQTAVAHGLSYTPTVVIATPQTNANVWESASPDGTNVYLTATATGNVDVLVM